MKCAHEMPFGARLLPGGGARFRLWAPAARRVDLVRSAGPDVGEAPMQPMPDGWFERTVPRADATTRYTFRIDGDALVPDPASRANPDDVHAASALVDPLAFEWPDEHWRGRPWHEAVIYELHVGCFTREGTFAAATGRLDELAALGVTAIELMPVAEFAGRRGWGYDGVLPFAPEASYGTPDDLKRLVAAAHGRGLMVLLDVVYNHFGPEGNYLHRYAPNFFDPRAQTPWGAAIRFDDRTVRRFFVHNALYWVEEFRIDGLRLDAVHAMHDRSRVFIADAIARALRMGPGRSRHVHTVLENDRNDAVRLTRGAGGLPRAATAQWNDDVHHALHVLVTGERDGYYADFGSLADVATALRHVYVFDGRYSPYRDRRHGRPVQGLPATRFLGYAQDHDQVGNRATGDRLVHVAGVDAAMVAAALVLTAPFVPMLFQGEEWGASAPFPYFTDHTDPELARAVSEGRRREFTAFGWDPESVPDPQDPATAASARLDWAERARDPHARLLAWHRDLLALRRSTPALTDGHLDRVDVRVDDDAGWLVVERGPVTVVVNVADAPRTVGVDHARPGEVVLASRDGWTRAGDAVTVPPCAVVVLAPA